jgi:hypothetical protein
MESEGRLQPPPTTGRSDARINYELSTSTIYVGYNIILRTSLVQRTTQRYGEKAGYSDALDATKRALNGRQRRSDLSKPNAWNSVFRHFPDGSKRDLQGRWSKAPNATYSVPRALLEFS